MRKLVVLINWAKICSIFDPSTIVTYPLVKKKIIHEILIQFLIIRWSGGGTFLFRNFEIYENTYTKDKEITIFCCICCICWIQHQIWERQAPKMLQISHWCFNFFITYLILYRIYYCLLENLSKANTQYFNLFKFQEGYSNLTFLNFRWCFKN